jgi:nicotinate-nucleotide adenylyltransferase
LRAAARAPRRKPGAARRYPFRHVHADGEAVAAARIGIFGGAFNPPHVGHLVLAQEAHWQLDLDTVVLVPFGEPAHRTLEVDPGPEVRFQMCDYAVAADARLGVSRIEIDRPGPSYTVDTLRELRRRAPDDELVLLIGGDQAAALATWRDPEEILTLAVVGVAERDEWRREEIASRLGGLGSPERIRFFDMPRVDVSSTLVRRRAAAGQPIRYLVPDKVANFIGAQSLYGSSAPVGAGA